MTEEGCEDQISFKQMQALTTCSADHKGLLQGERSELKAMCLELSADWLKMKV